MRGSWSPLQCPNHPERMNGSGCGLSAVQVAAQIGGDDDASMRVRSKAYELLRGGASSSLTRIAECTCRNASYIVHALSDHSQKRIEVALAASVSSKHVPSSRLSSSS